MIPFRSRHVSGPCIKDNFFANTTTWKINFQVLRGNRADSSSTFLPFVSRELSCSRCRISRKEKNRFRERAGNFSRAMCESFAGVGERYDRSFTRARAPSCTYKYPRERFNRGGHNGGRGGVVGSTVRTRGQRWIKKHEWSGMRAGYRTAYVSLSWPRDDGSQLRVCVCAVSRYLFALPCVKALYASFPSNSRWWRVVQHVKNIKIQQLCCAQFPREYSL